MTRLIALFDLADLPTRSDSIPVLHELPSSASENNIIDDFKSNSTFKETGFTFDQSLFTDQIADNSTQIFLDELNQNKPTTKRIIPQLLKLDASTPNEIAAQPKVISDDSIVPKIHSAKSPEKENLHRYMNKTLITDLNTEYIAINVDIDSITNNDKTDISASRSDR